MRLVGVREEEDEEEDLVVEVRLPPLEDILDDGGECGR